MEFENNETYFDVELANDCEVGRYKTTLTIRGFGHSMYDQRTIRLVLRLSIFRVIENSKLSKFSRHQYLRDINRYFQLGGNCFTFEKFKNA